MSGLSIESGFYGKLPSRGDFIQRRMPQAFVDVWDAWLQECLHESREQLGPQWLDRYLTGPLWRFVLDAGIGGDVAQAGILVPSVDRVGRYFPLTILVQVPPGLCPLDVACGATQWFEEAETLALDALETDALDADAFDARVAKLPVPIVSDGAALGVSMGTNLGARLVQRLRDSAFPQQSSQWCVPLEDARSLQHAVNAFAYRELTRELEPLALWWTEGSGSLGASWLATRGLPEARAFTAMLSGDWAGCGWASVTGAAPASSTSTSE